MKYKHFFNLLIIFSIFFQLTFNPLSVFSDNDLPSPSQNSLRIVSYNIRFAMGALGDQEISKISNFLSSIDADIICLQEVDRSTMRSFLIDQPRKLKKDLFMEAAFGETDNVIPGKTGNLILSKFPIINIENIKLPSIKYSRALLKITVDTSQGPLNIINTHLALSKNIRNQQIEIINNAIIHDNIPTIVAGDFNTSNIEEVVPLLSELLDPAVVKNKTHLKTFKSKRINSRIDYILIPRSFLVNHYSVSSFDSSDHFPVIVDITQKNIE